MRVFSRIPVFVLGSISLHAEAIEPEALNDIYVEAVLFVTVFAVMSIISFIISKRHAREYVGEETPPEEDSLVPVNEKENIEYVDMADDKRQRLNELTKMLKERVLSEAEFRLLRQSLIERG